VKKDLLIAVIAIALVLGLAYGLNAMRPQLVPTPSHPFSATTGAVPEAAPNETVVMRVNGEPVTEREFAIFASGLSPQAQMYLENPAGRRVVAEQYVRMKALEQEGRRLGAEADPDVAAKMRFGKTNVTVEYAIKKLGEKENDKLLQDEYNKSKSDFDAVDLSHIVIGYQGGQIPSRRQPAPTQEQAMNMAQQVAAEIRKGQPFEKLAAMVSDDQQSAQVGGRLGMVPLAQLPPEIQQAVRHLGPGQMSDAVMTQFGAHVFRVNQRRTQSFAEVKPQLQQRARETVLRNEIERLAKAAKVDLDPKFFPPAPKGKTPSS